MDPNPPRTAAGKAFSPRKPMLVSIKVVGASKMPAAAAHGGANSPDHGKDRLDRNPHIICGQLVLRGGLHGDAKPCMREEGVRARRQRRIVATITEISVCEITNDPIDSGSRRMPSLEKGVDIAYVSVPHPGTIPAALRAIYPKPIVTMTMENCG